MSSEKVKMYRPLRAWGWKVLLIGFLSLVVSLTIATVLEQMTYGPGNLPEMLHNTLLGVAAFGGNAILIAVGMVFFSLFTPGYPKHLKEQFKAQEKKLGGSPYSKAFKGSLAIIIGCAVIAGVIGLISLASEDAAAAIGIIAAIFCSIALIAIPAMYLQAWLNSKNHQQTILSMIENDTALDEMFYCPISSAMVGIDNDNTHIQINSQRYKRDDLSTIEFESDGKKHNVLKFVTNQGEVIKTNFGTQATMEAAYHRLGAVLNMS